MQMTSAAGPSLQERLRAWPLPHIGTELHRGRRVEASDHAVLTMTVQGSEID